MTRTLVIGGNPGQWNYSDPDPPFRIANGVEAWVGALRGDWHGRQPPSRTKVSGYDLIIANLNPSLIPAYLELMQHRPPHQRWVALVEGCGLSYLDPWPDLIRMMNGCDLVANINRQTTRYLSTLCKTPVEWIGIPYPVKEVRAFATARSQQRDEVLVCPRQQRGPSFAVANALGLSVRAYFMKVPTTMKSLPIYLRHRYFGKDLRAHFWLKERSDVPRVAGIERDMPTFWREGGGCRLWINLDPRYTWARFVLDAAALGVPILTTRSTAHGPALYPETCLDDMFDIDQAIALGQKLLGDEEFAQTVIATAQRGLDEFTPEACVKRLSTALKMDL